MIKVKLTSIILFFSFLSSCGTVSPSPTEEINISPTIENNFQISITHPELEIISRENIDRLEKIDQWGKGFLGGVDISPDGMQIATYTPTGVYLYNTLTYEESKIEFPRNYINNRWPDSGAIQYRPDGKAVAFGTQNIHIWNFLESKFETTLINRYPNSQVSDISFSPDGNFLMVKSHIGFSPNCEDNQDNLGLYEMKTNRLLFDVSFCWRGGAYFYFTENDTTYIFLTSDVSARPPYKVIKIKTSTGEVLQEDIYSFDNFEDSRIYGTSLDDEFLISIKFEKENLITYLINSKSMAIVQKLDNQRIFFTPNKNRMWVLKGTIEDVIYSKATFELQDKNGQVLCTFSIDDVPYTHNFSDDGNLMVVSSFPSQVEIWNISTCAMSKKIDFPSPDSNLIFSPSGADIVATDSWTIYIWDVKSGKYKFTIPAYLLLGNVPPFDFNPEGTILITLRGDEDTNDYKLVEINLDTGLDKNLFGEANTFTEHILFSNENTIATLTQFAKVAHFEVWDIDSQKSISKISAENIDVAISQDKSKVALRLKEETNSIKVINLVTGEVFSESSFPASSIDFLTNDTLLVGEYNSENRDWSFSIIRLNGDVIKKIVEDSNTCPTRDFKVIQNYLVYLCEDYRIQILDTITNHFKTFIGHYTINFNEDRWKSVQVEISPNGNILVSTSYEFGYSTAENNISNIRFWDISTGVLINEIQENFKIKNIEFSPDGRLFTYLSEDGLIHVLGIPINENP